MSYGGKEVNPWEWISADQFNLAASGDRIVFAKTVNTHVQNNEENFFFIVISLLLN